MNQSHQPLAERMRPTTFDDFKGQEDLVGQGKLLRTLITQDTIPSMIFWGPPGCGKTTLARVIAEQSKSSFQQLSAVSSGKEALKKVVETAEKLYQFNGQRTILFLDEIHRWNKAQQDALLPYVERGTVTLIGATTENPSFEVVSPLLSRCRVFVLKPLTADALQQVLKQTLTDSTRGLGGRGVTIDDDAADACVQFSNGDARTALNALEIAANTNPHVTLDGIRAVFQQTHLLYDKKGDEHYNIISAFIKSLRGSNPDAALYWMSRMLGAGEDPLFVARRMVVMASEDIGIADSHALPLATTCMQAVHMVGMPEARILLAHVATYLATAPKSNATYAALLAAEEDVRTHLNLPVPLHLRNAPTKLMKDLGYGKDYLYTHDHPDEKQEFLPEELKGKKYYRTPSLPAGRQVAPPCKGGEVNVLRKRTFIV